MDSFFSQKSAHWKERGARKEGNKKGTTESSSTIIKELRGGQLIKDVVPHDVRS
jgi:hypothetical protein